jgi:hypothetical protein
VCQKTLTNQTAALWKLALEVAVPVDARHLHYGQEQPRSRFLGSVILVAAALALAAAAKFRGLTVTPLNGLDFD